MYCVYNFYLFIFSGTKKNQIKVITTDQNAIKKYIEKKNSHPSDNFRPPCRFEYAECDKNGIFLIAHRATSRRQLQNFKKIAPTVSE